MNLKLTIILSLISIVNLYFIYVFVKDLKANTDKIKEEKNNPIIMSISQFFIYFLTTFGISDFAIGASLYPKMKWVEDRKLPGTFNTACVVPVFALAIIYITNVQVGWVTLAVPIICQVAGAYFSHGFIMKLSQEKIQRLVVIGLLIAGAIILLGKFNLMPVGGDKTSLEPFKLVILGVLSFVYGGFNNMGIGAYPLIMATVYALGLNPIVAFPIMMGSCAMSVPIGAVKFIKMESYSRRVTMFSATFGLIGVIFASLFVKSLDISMLQWLALIVIMYSAFTMILAIRKESQLEPISVK